MDRAGRPGSVFGEIEVAKTHQHYPLILDMYETLTSTHVFPDDLMASALVNSVKQAMMKTLFLLICIFRTREATWKLRDQSKERSKTK